MTNTNHIHLANTTLDEHIAWDGADLTTGEYQRVFLTREGLEATMDGGAHFQMCPQCWGNFTEDVERKQREAAERQRQWDEAQERNNKMARRRNQVEELAMDLAQAHRNGDSDMVARIVEQLTEIDTQHLAEFGVSSWDDLAD